MKPRVLNVPADLPPNIRYWIVGGDLSEHLRYLLEAVRQESVCLGFARVGQVPDDGHFVLADADWPAAEQKLLAAGVDPDRIHILPIPTTNEWAYWRLSKKVSGHITAGGGIDLDGPAFWEACAFPDRLKDPLWGVHYVFRHPEMVKDSLPRIQTVMANLADRESREILAMILSANPPVFWEHYKRNIFRHLQYFDCVTVSPGDVILNAGIAGGFEIPVYLAHMEGRGALHCFDPLGFDGLSDYVRTSVGYFPGVVHEQRLALGDHDGTVRLVIREDGEAMAAGPGAEEAQDFPCVRTDTFVRDRGLSRIDLISMDLEGGETTALPGMVETISRFRPQLSVSVYHSMNHYWDIPLFMMNVCEGYRFYLRLYSFERYEAILYAVPNERPVAADRNPG